MSLSYQSLYAKYVPIAMNLSPSSVVVFRGDVRVALVNIKIGIQSVLGTPEQIARARDHLPLVPIDDVLELPDMARALLFAIGKVVTRKVSAGEIDAAVQAIRGPRQQMLAFAELLAERGKLDKSLVANIRKGSGKCDMAQDGVDLAGLYTDNAAKIAGLHPFSVVEIDALRRDSEWLLEHLTPTGARKAMPAKNEADDVRDRLWTMIAQRHPYLRTVGHYFLGDDFERGTPKLQSRIVSTAGSEHEEVAPPAPVSN
jgi:hypothetical protein